MNRREQIYQVTCTLYNAVECNTISGRWFRMTRFQAVTLSTAVLYVILCLVFVLIKVAYHAWTVIK